MPQAYREFTKQSHLTELVRLLETGQTAEALVIAKEIRQNAQACAHPTCDCSGPSHCPVYAPGLLLASERGSATEWQSAAAGQVGIFRTRNGKYQTFADPVCEWKINKYGLTHWLANVPPAE